MQSNNIQLPQWLLQATSIAIIGFGREGQSTYKFLRSHLSPTISILIYDHALNTKEANIETLRSVDTALSFAYGEIIDGMFNEYNVVFKTPGIPKSALRMSTQFQGYLTSQADLFTQVFGKQMIAVTGTKGKSTTAHALTHVLSENGQPVELVGNIGKPALDYFDSITEKTIIVFEMSSFQCESLHTGPQVSICTSLYPDHLDYYETYQEYVNAKKHLFDLQTQEQTCIYRCDSDQVRHLIIDSQAKKFGYSDIKQPDSTAWIEDGWITDTTGALCAVDSLQIKGTQSVVNVLPSVIVMHQGILGIDPTNSSTKSIVPSLQSITPLPGRLELIATKNGISFYDDALATIPEATIAAIETLGEEIQTLIVGGHERNQDFSKLAQIIASSQIQTLVLFPPTGKRLGELVKKINPSLQCIAVQSMSQAIQECFAHTQPGKIVLLSTASPSFGIFDDYRDRSAQYKTCIDQFPQSS